MKRAPILFFIIIVSIHIPLIQSYQYDLVEFDSNPIIAQDGITSWHHDCSNTTGFVPNQSANGDLGSNGHYFYFENTTTDTDWHGAVFEYEFSETFSLAGLVHFSTQIYSYNIGADSMGQITVGLMDADGLPVFMFSVHDEDSQDVEINRHIYYLHTDRLAGFDYTSTTTTDWGSITDNSTFWVTVDGNSVYSRIEDSSLEQIGNLGTEGSRQIQYLFIQYLEYESEDPLDFRVSSIDVQYDSSVTNNLETGTELIIGERLSNQFMNSGQQIFYHAHLEPGDWRVTVGAADWLSVKIIIVTEDSTYESGEGTGDFPSIVFTLNSSQAVSICIAENSAYGDSAGFYSIEVNSYQTPAETIDSGLLIIIGLVSSFIFIAVIYVFRVRGGANRFSRPHQLREVESFHVTPPDFVIPEKHRSDTHSDETGIRTVRLPTHCPSCKGPVIQEEIDWTGPLQAKCNYCGSPLRATLEKL